jgi:hypothetical protein
MEVTEPGIVIEVIFEQPLKAELPIETMELPIFAFVKPIHPSKAEVPIDTTELGTLISDKLVQP